MTEPSLIFVAEEEGPSPWKGLEVPTEAEAVPDDTLLIIANRFIVPEGRSVANLLTLDLPRHEKVTHPLKLFFKK